jgi:GT2 family glycosyltransferase
MRIREAKSMPRQSTLARPQRIPQQKNSQGPATFFGTAADLNHAHNQQLRKTVFLRGLNGWQGHCSWDSVRPLVSFVIPVRNDAQRLHRCLASIVRNDYPRELIELIVVDNESTDGSARAARDYGAIVIKASGTSVASLRNRGARAALGGIIAFVDADHQIAPTWIETAVDVLSDPTVAATGAAYVTQPSANWVQRQYDGLRTRPLGREEVSWLGSGNLAIKRAVFERVGGFDASLTACEDVDLCNRVGQAGHRIIADSRLRSIHFGDPATLKALFFGELWRGRDNIRVTFNGPWTIRHWRSALVPVADLVLLGAAPIAAAAGRPGMALASIGLIVALGSMRAAAMMARHQHRGVVAFSQALLVSLVFDVARAAALLARGSHAARRGTPASVPDTLHS